jgi:apolipoprotein N-acyltransferase
LLRGRVVAAALSVPALWVAYEYINNLHSINATFFNISYTQADALPVIQLVAVTGLWGVGFLLLLVPTVASLQLWPLGARRTRWTIAGCVVLTLVAVLAYGGWRLQQAPTSTVRIGLVALNDHGIRPLSSAEGEARQARYMDAMQRLIGEHAKILLIPEDSFITDTATIPAFASLANQQNVTVAAGIAFHLGASDAHNMLTVFEPGATSPATYSKHHLLLGLEQFVPGDSFTMLDGQPRIGLAICKDMDFLDIGHAYAARHAQMLLVPAFDFEVDGWLHSRMAVVRGVESGFAVARAARAGRLTLSDDRGRVVAETSSVQRDAELVGDLPLHDTTTLYSSLGDWFAWLDLVILAGVLVVAFLPETRLQRTPQAEAP